MLQENYLKRFLLLVTPSGPASSKKIGGSGNAGAPFLEKFKWIHWSTYQRLKHQDQEKIRAMDLAMMMQCLKWMKKIPGEEDKREKN